MIQSGKGLGVPQASSDIQTSDRPFSLKNSGAVWKCVRGWATQQGAQTFEDQGSVQRPNVAKAPLFPFGFEKHTARPINENVDSVVGLKHTQVSKWVAREHGRECALICRKARVEVGVLLKGDTCIVLQFVTAKVPKDF
jgi:hypothetical protein